MNLRERKKARTRRLLADGAIQLFVTRGFEATTVDDIVDAAGVSRRTFFRYFPSKEAAFFAHHDDRFDRFCALIAERVPAQGAWNAVCGVLLELGPNYEADREGALAWRATLRTCEPLLAYDLQADARWEAAVASAFRRTGDSALDAAVRAGALMGVVRAVLVSWYEGEGRGDLVAMGREALDWLSTGLAERRLVRRLA